ncbi:MAG: alginate lyase family protein [candidate division Zixibacteria bacterium]|nr:alginate lyase family protein [candidate division Zixibacteria bacterium]
MKLRPIIIKIKLKLKALSVKYRPRVKPLAIDAFYEKHWNGSKPDTSFFANRTTSKFFFDSSSRDSYLKILRQFFPQNCHKIISAADKILENRFDMLGSGDYKFRESINWHLDFKSGFVWPKKHYTEIRIVNLNNSADIKIPWELSRLQFLTTLGRAYWLSEDEKYKNKFVQILTDWEKDNPVDIGANWTCSMDVAIRAVNVIWGLQLFSKSNELHSIVVQKAIRLLYYHALHIERNLEVIADGANTNHLIADYIGLYYIGLLFPEFDRSEKWLKIAETGLEKEIQLQVLEDGADYECSFSYHRLVLEMFLSVYILGQKNGRVLSTDYRNKLAAMIRFSSAMTAPSGNTPSIGDNDDGFLVMLDNNNPMDHRHLIDTGAIVLDLEVPANVTSCEERLWYLGPDSLRIEQATSKPKSRFLKSSGYAVIRDDRTHLTFDAAPITGLGFGGHKHNDLLSITLEIDKVPFLIDSGTACYTSDYHKRNLSRSTAVHNTIRLDDQEQVSFFDKLLFLMPPDGKPKIDLWTSLNDKVIVSATHKGYLRLADEIIHRRTIEASLANQSFEITDELTGNGIKEHKIELSYLTALECKEQSKRGGFIIVDDDGKSLVLTVASEVAIQSGIVPAEYYPRYGVTAKASKIIFELKSKMPVKITTFMKYVRSPIDVSESENYFARVRHTEKVNII